MKYPMTLLLFCAFGVFSSHSISQEKDSNPYADKMLPALFNKQIQAELELVEDQKSELKSFLNGLQERRKQMGQELKTFQESGATPAEFKAKRIEIVDELESEKSSALTDVMNILLPHQKKRLEQTTAQYMMREAAKSQKLPTGILAPEIRKYLEIDDAQAEKIKARASKIQQELAEKIRKLTAQAQTQLTNELTHQQRSKLDELIGERIK